MGARFLITNDGAVGPGAPLRPAVINPDGSGLRPLDATRNPDLILGCGHVSPDGTRIAIEGFGKPGHRALDGIYSVRASEGGGLVRLVKGPTALPSYSPDGAQLVFTSIVGGVNPTGSGALFVANADATDVTRITPFRYVFDQPSWSPDGRVDRLPEAYGQLYLVHPDGSGLHRIPLALPDGAGAQDPAWSPDGSMIVFSLLESGHPGIYRVRPDGSGLQRWSLSTTLRRRTGVSRRRARPARPYGPIPVAEAPHLRPTREPEGPR